ncbi:MAG: DUF4350 domain-containing protein [Chitinophagaceae bacterium]|nr:DUF4350 domain-containing protein [Chitinophagaceae bacterium]MBK8951766.1 DUF4350 domain-containing protein [Chitinophagaceae bacterium]
MKKYLPYLILFLVVAAIAALLFTGGGNSHKKVMDQRITLRRQDKLPYGTYVAFNSLPDMLPGASIYVSRQEPGFWDSLSTYDPNQAFIFIGDKFSADEYELKRLVKFAEKGNDVFISARYISAAADEFFGCNSSSFDMSFITESELQDSMQIELGQPPFSAGSLYAYPGLTFSSYFTSINKTTTDVLGYDEKGHANFIHLAAGKGHVYLQLEPLAFSNYFLLHKDNIGYYEKAFSLINPGVKKVVWDEYYLSKKRREENKDKKKGWFRVLMNLENSNGDKPFRAAFWVLLALLGVYVLMEMRRKQRYIPVVKSPRNDSLDFVKTIGRLYYDKGDHKNLCRKMAAYFLEHIRSRYKLPTNNLDEKFVKQLQFKTGVEEREIQQLVDFILFLDSGEPAGKNQLAAFHSQLENFYSKA